MRRSHAPTCWSLAVAVAGLFLFPATPAHAWRFSYDLSLGVEYTDNVGRRASDPREEYILRPELRFALTEAGDTVQVEAIGTASWRDYRRGVFDDELRIDIGGRLNWIMLDERLAWTVENYLAEEPVNVFVSASPDNIQRTNFFSTGPTLSFRFSPVLAGRAEVRWQDTYAEEVQAFNSRRAAAALRLIRSLDALTTLAGNIEVMRVRPDRSEADVFDNDRLAAYGRWARQTARRSLSVDLGYSWVDFDDAQDSDGLLFRGRLSHELSESSTLEFDLAREYSDAAADLLLRAPSDADLDVPVTAGAGFGVNLTPDVFLDRRVGGAWTLRGQRLEARVRADYREQTFDRSPILDRRVVGSTVGLDYRLSPTTNLGVFLTANDQRRLAGGADALETDFGVRLRYQARTSLWLVGELVRARRDGDLPDDDFTETRAFIGLTFTRD